MEHLPCAGLGRESEASVLGVPGWLSRLSVRLLIFGSGHDLTVHGIKPRIGLCADSAEPARDSLFPSLSAPPLLSLSLSLKINK